MITQKQKECYERLFEITKNNMTASGNSMEITKDGFMSYVSGDTVDTDIIQMSSFSRKAFFQATYALLLRRFPDEQAMINYSNDVEKDDETYKRKLIESIKSCQEFNSKQGVIHNNIYSTKNVVTPGRVYFDDYPLLNKIYSKYRKLPQSFRRRIRRLFGRQE